MSFKNHLQKISKSDQRSTSRTSSECSLLIPVFTCCIFRDFFRVLLRVSSIFLPIFFHFYDIRREFVKFIGIIFQDIEWPLTGKGNGLWLLKCDFSQFYQKTNFRSQERDKKWSTNNSSLWRIYPAEIAAEIQKWSTWPKMSDFCKRTAGWQTIHCNDSVLSCSNHFLLFHNQVQTFLRLSVKIENFKVVHFFSERIPKNEYFI